ncbi:MAG: polysaccharide biosynthesis protein [Eubacteriaceae bacterium]|nr:polysaccharide biosynthesis protein [Eubacteriaceae bacterium]
MSGVDKGSKFIKGAAILGIAGVMIKVMGAVFRIPLTNWIGDEGMSYYGVAYTIYSALLVLATAGIPVAISRMVSERIAVGEYRNAHKVFKVATALMFGIGLISFAICFFGGDLITKLLQNPEAALAVKAIAPALLFVPVMSSFRGYFQGRQNMNPTAVSQMLEQLVRVGFGLALAYIFMKTSLIKAAAGASFGASAGSLAGLVTIVLIYFLNRRVIHKKNRLHSQNTESTSVILKKIVVIAVPIIIGSEILPLMSVIDTSIIMGRLQDTGWSYDEAKSMYGQLSGFCNSLIAFPQVFTQAVAVSLVPAVAAAFRMKDKESIQSNIQLGYRTTMIMACPCAVGIFALAEPILLMLYPAQKASAIAAVPTLMIMALSVVFLAIDQTSTGILQAIGKQNLPVVNLFIGCLGKIVITYVLVGIKAVNIKGAAIGTIFAYVVSLLLNNTAIKKHTGTKINYDITYVRPLAASLIMGVCAFASHKLLASILGNSLATLFAICVGAAVYVVLIFAFKAITLDELENIPGGTKLKSLIGKFVKS